MFKVVCTFSHTDPGHRWHFEAKMRHLQPPSQGTASHLRVSWKFGPAVFQRPGNPILYHAATRFGWLRVFTIKRLVTLKVEWQKTAASKQWWTDSGRKAKLHEGESS